MAIVRKVRSNQSEKNSNFRMLQPDEIKFGLSDIIGHDECKKEFGNILLFLKNPDLYLKFGIEPYTKYMLIGPDGVGKSSLACAVAKDAGVPIFIVEPSFFLMTQKLLVETDRLFEKVQEEYEKSNCMLLFKGIHYLSTIDGKCSQPLIEKLISFFREIPLLVSFAAFSTNMGNPLLENIIVPPAFSKLIELLPPELKVRETILKDLLKDLPVEQNFNYRRLSLDTAQMTTGELKTLVKDSFLLSVQREEKELTYLDFAEALAQSAFGYVTSELNEKERIATARHEAGHVIAGYFANPENYKISKVEILPRSNYLGLTQETMDEEKKSFFKSDLDAEIISTLGGMASEEYYYNEHTSGVSNDLNRATIIAAGMVQIYGMSKEIGPICVRAEQVNLSALEKDSNYVIRNYLKTLYNKTTEIIRKHSDALDELTNALLANEVLYEEEVMAILKKYDT